MSNDCSRWSSVFLSQTYKAIRLCGLGEFQLFSEPKVILLPKRDRFRGTHERRRVDVRDRIAAFKHRAVELRFVSKESGAPNPRISGRLLLREDLFSSQKRRRISPSPTAQSGIFNFRKRRLSAYEKRSPDGKRRILRTVESIISFCNF